MTVEAWLREAFADPLLALRLDPSWGAAHADGRRRLREAMAETAAKRHPDLRREAEALREPSRLPVHPLLGFSVSHSASLGGFVCSSALDVGFDVEASARVSVAACERIAFDGREAAEAPSPAAYWTAKEAAFKALARTGLQPKTIAAVRVSGWRPARGPDASPDAFLDAFQCEAHAQGLEAALRGTTWRLGENEYCFFSIPLNQRPGRPIRAS